MSHPPWPVLYEDNHCLAVNKPNGLLVMSDGTEETTLHREACAYLKEKYQKPGQVFLGIVHRLDRQVSGVIVMARTSKGAARLSAQFKDRTVDKRYWAVVAGRPKQTQGRLVSHLHKDTATNVVKARPIPTSQTQEAVLDYRVLQSLGPVSLVEVQLLTGRSHQVRVQLAELGHPIVGDTKYGSVIRLDWGLALHARQLSFQHPTQEKTIQLEAPTPREWSRWKFA